MISDLPFTETNAIKYPMRETIAGVVAAGAFALSPHPMEQPAALTPAQVVQPEHPGAAALDSDPQLLPHPDNYQNLAISEFLDPDTVAFWIELGIGTIGLTGVGGFVTSRRLRKSLRKDHLDIQANGWEAQNKLNTALVDAKQQAAGLREDDAPKLRELIASHSPTSDILFGALASTGPEFTTEHDR